MNVASWIILIAIVAWIAIAIKATFFGGFRKKSARTDAGVPSSGELPSEDGDAKYRVDIPQCGGCDKASCASCPIANRDIPMPTIRELK